MGEDGNVFHVSKLFIDCGFVWEDVKTCGGELRTSVTVQELSEVGTSADGSQWPIIAGKRYFRVDRERRK